MLWARWGSAAFERLAWTGAGQPPAAGPVPVQLQAAQVARIPMAGLWTARIQALAARTAAVQPPQGLDCRSSRKRRKTEKNGENRRKTKKRRKREKNGENPSWLKKPNLGHVTFPLHFSFVKWLPRPLWSKIAKKSEKSRMLLNASYFPHSHFLSFCSESAPKWPGKPLYKGKL